MNIKSPICKLLCFLYEKAIKKNYRSTKNGDIFGHTSGGGNKKQG